MLLMEDRMVCFPQKKLFPQTKLGSNLLCVSKSSWADLRGRKERRDSQYINSIIKFYRISFKSYIATEWRVIVLQNKNNGREEGEEKARCFYLANNDFYLEVSCFSTVSRFPFCFYKTNKSFLTSGKRESHGDSATGLVPRLSFGSAFFCLSLEKCRSINRKSKLPLY